MWARGLGTLQNGTGQGAPNSPALGSPAHATGVFGHACPRRMETPGRGQRPLGIPPRPVSPRPAMAQPPLRQLSPPSPGEPPPQCLRMQRAGSMREQKPWARVRVGMQREQSGDGRRRRGVHKARAPPTLLSIPSQAPGTPSRRDCGSGAAGGQDLSAHPVTRRQRRTCGRWAWARQGPAGRAGGTGRSCAGSVPGQHGSAGWRSSRRGGRGSC